MKYLSCIFAIIFFCAFLGVQETKAQGCPVAIVYGTSFAWQSGNTVYGYSSTSLNYCAALYYDPATWGRFSEGNWATENPILLASAYTEGYADWTPARINYSYRYPANNEYYNVDTHHYVLEYYQRWNCFGSSCGYYWYDYWGFGFLGGNSGGPTYYAPGTIGYWGVQRRTVGRTFHSILYQGQTQCAFGAQFTPTGKPCAIITPTPTPTPAATITAQIKDLNGNDITGTEQVVMLGVPTKLVAASNASNATFSWSVPSGKTSSSTGSSIRASWASTGTYTVSLTATAGQMTKTVQATIKVQAPVFDKIEATQRTPRLLSPNVCEYLPKPWLSLGCDKRNERGIDILASAKAPAGDISNQQEAKIKFVQLANAYRTKKYSNGEIHCLTERTSPTDTTTGWKIDKGDPFQENKTIDGYPVIDNFSGGAAVAKIGDSPGDELDDEIEQFVDDAFETFVVYYVKPVEGDTVQRVIGKLAWNWRAKAVKENNQFQLKTEFSIPSAVRSLTGAAVTEVADEVEDIRPYTGRVQDLDYEPCGGAPRELNSMFVTQSIRPVVAKSTQFPVSITMKNTGTRTWTKGKFLPVFIGDTLIFRTSREFVSSDVAPGQTVKFDIDVLAPNYPTSGYVRWEMAEVVTTAGGTQLVRFGQKTPFTRIQVIEGSNPPPAPTPQPPSDLTVWRPSTGHWWVLAANGSYQGAQFGAGVDKPYPGDFDGDGLTDFSVFRPDTDTGNGTWHIQHSGSLVMHSYQYGLNDDVKVPADYDGDGKTDLAVFRPSNKTWYIHNSSNQTISSATFGFGTDLTAPADYDGDGKADVAVYRQSDQAFYVLQSSNGQFKAQVLGQTTAGVPVSADYDGDGKDDFAVKDGNVWHIKHSFTGFTSKNSWEEASDKPVQNDYDGDGKVDIAVWRESTGVWYIRNSSDFSTRSVQWGAAGDFPVPAYYRK